MSIHLLHPTLRQRILLCKLGTHGSGSAGIEALSICYGLWSTHRPTVQVITQHYSCHDGPLYSLIHCTDGTSGDWSNSQSFKRTISKSPNTYPIDSPTTTHSVSLTSTSHESCEFALCSRRLRTRNLPQPAAHTTHANAKPRNKRKSLSSAWL